MAPRPQAGPAVTCALCCLVFAAWLVRGTRGDCATTGEPTFTFENDPASNVPGAQRLMLVNDCAQSVNYDLDLSTLPQPITSIHTGAFDETHFRSVSLCPTLITEIGAQMTGPMVVSEFLSVDGCAFLHSIHNDAIEVSSPGSSALVRLHNLTALTYIDAAAFTVRGFWAHSRGCTPSYLLCWHVRFISLLRCPTSKYPWLLSQSCLPPSSLKWGQGAQRFQFL